MRLIGCVGVKNKNAAFDNQRCTPMARDVMPDYCFLPTFDAYGIVEFIVLGVKGWHYDFNTVFRKAFHQRNLPLSLDGSAGAKRW